MTGLLPYREETGELKCTQSMPLSSPNQRLFSARHTEHCFVLQSTINGNHIHFILFQIKQTNPILHRAKCQQRLVKSSTKHTIVLHKAICNTIELLHRLAIIDKKAVVTGGYQNLANSPDTLPSISEPGTKLNFFPSITRTPSAAPI